MDANALRGITSGVYERKVDPVLEAYLSQFAVELKGVFQKMRELARDFPPGLEPAPVFQVRRRAEGFLKND